ncbi:MAG: hypothetical protein K6C32_00035 [Bacilli bacterium]|nr:hypothetical protein [Bacilli bacterium]
MSKIKNKKSLSPYLLVIISFLVVIIVGSFLLTTPFAQASGKWAFNLTYTAANGETIHVTYLDCLFTAVSATCVTGLCTFSQGIGNTLTLTGQIIVLIMIQIGGLGFITVLTFVVTLFKSKLQFKDRVFLSQALNATNFADVVKFVRKIVVISLICESIGFLLGLPVVFILYPDNIGKALWTSLFTSISAFNNAGFDTFGSTSLIADSTTILGTLKEGTTWAYYYYLSYIMVLIVVGGLSFLVILEVFSFKKSAKQFSAFTKIVLTTNAILLLSGWLIFYLTDGLFGSVKISVFDALFQSVTCRTAGFATFDQDTLSTAGRTMSCFLMFVGGSPLSTAGGIKTTTVFIVFVAIFSHLKGRRVVSFNREYSSNTILKGMTLMVIAILVISLAFVGVSTFERNNASVNTERAFFEVFSAFGTVGLTANLTPLLGVGSKIILCVLMFLGRLGPMTFFQVFKNNVEVGHFKYIEEDFLVG